MEKQRWEQPEKRREEEDQRRERVRGKKMQAREQVEKSRFTVFFPMICGSGGLKSRLKPQVRSHLARCEMRNCTPLWREALFEVKSVKNWSLGPLLEVEMSKKVDAVLARSTFRSKNVQSTSVSEHFWKMRCSKSARRCGAKQISKSKC